MRNYAAALSLMFTGWLLSQPLEADAMIYVEATGSDETRDCRDPLTPCRSLREGIERASWGETIRIGEGIFPATGLKINKNLYLTGEGRERTIIEGAQLRGEADDRIILIGARARVEISRVTIRHGTALIVDEPHGGGIFNDGYLRLGYSTIRDNDAGPDGHGGGIYNNTGATLFLDTLLVSGNNAGDGTTAAGGIANSGGSGGGIFNKGTLHARRVSVIDNHAGTGGPGIFNGGEGGYGGGLFNCGEADFQNSVFGGCTAGPGGDAISNNGVGGGGGSGGAIDSTNHPISLGQCTLTNNHAGEGGLPNGSGGCGGCCHNNSSGEFFQIYQCVLYGNTVPPTGCGPDFGGTSNSLGYNIIGDTGFFLIGGITTGNQIGVNPLLQPFDTSAFPPCYPLGAASTAIDAGDPVSPTIVDIYGNRRVGRNDIGACENGGIPSEDDDGDGIPNFIDDDSDGDGMADSWERANGLVVGVVDDLGDKDGDGMLNGSEYLYGNDPCDPLSNLCLTLNLDKDVARFRIDGLPTDRPFSLRRASSMGSRWDGVDGQTNVFPDPDGTLLLSDDFGLGDTAHWTLNSP